MLTSPNAKVRSKRSATGQALWTAASLGRRREPAPERIRAHEEKPVTVLLSAQDQRHAARRRRKDRGLTTQWDTSNVAVAEES